MEHYTGCERYIIWDKICSEFYKHAADPMVEGMLRGLKDADQMCACMARSWGLNVTLGAGLRIGEHKARRYMMSWLEGIGEEAQARRIKALAERINGRNVIPLRSSSTRTIE